MAYDEKTNRMHPVTRRHILIGGSAVVGTAAAVGAGAAIFALEKDKKPAGISTPSPISTVANGNIITSQLVRENGPGPINHTDSRWGVYGADLGHMFMHRDKMYMVFGDTFGAPAAEPPFLSVEHADWRSNTMAWVEGPTHPSQGLIFGGMITDQAGHAKELLPSLKVSGNEMTVIPTYGVSVASRMFLHYMSVNTWGAPGHWTLNSSGLAYSDDDGQSWTKDPKLTWPGDSNFGQVAIVEDGGYLYFFGIPGGRYGGVQLARVEPQAILDKTAYHYWNGTSWLANDAARAATIVPAPVGELSVRWNSHYKKWLMMYLNDPQAKIVLRTSDSLTGPWSDERTVVTGEQYPQLYAPYITPLWNDGPDIFYTMSLFGPYCVYLMRTRI